MVKQCKKRIGWTWMMVFLLSILFCVPSFAEESEEEETEPSYDCSINLSGDSILNVEKEVYYTVAPEVRKGDTKLELKKGEFSYTTTWSVEDPSVATIDSETGVLTGVSPGRTTLHVEVVITDKTVDPVKTITKSAKLEITVSGIVLDFTKVEMLENEKVALPSYKVYGGAVGQTVTWTSDSVNVATIKSDNYIASFSAGTATITAAAGPLYTATVEVTVKVNEAQSIKKDLEVGENQDFESLIDDIEECCEQMLDVPLSYVTNLMVSTDQGILYLNYRSEDEPGAGVAQGGNYYTDSAKSGPYLSDITFVPSPYYTGDTVTISYVGVGTDKRTFNGKIVLSLEPIDSDISMSATPNSPAEFSSEVFNQMCQKLHKSILDSVTFSLPAETRGTLYYDYVSDTDYDSKIGVGEKYKLSELDRITFVPAPGYDGKVEIYYTGYTVGGDRYVGKVIITVNQTNESGPRYDVSSGGVVTFDEDDFDDYCDDVTGNDLSRIRFSLPSSSEGVLYYDYKTSTNTGERVSNTTIYYADRAPRISRISFVANEDFSGKVEIPFTGWDERNTSFQGILEIHVRTGSGSGDITYDCRAGSYVKLVRSDFNNLCDSITDSKLDYITFQTLPSTSDGKLYLNRTSSKSGTRVTTGTKYTASSISKLSFWATDSFNGSAECSFTGTAENGDTFQGTLTFDAQDSISEEITYSGKSGKFIEFDRDDFDDLCDELLDSGLRYVRFTLPSTKQGTLYYNYSTSSKNNTKVSENKSYYYSSNPYLDKVGFLPKDSFSGTAEIEFKAYATSGKSFEGVIKVYVQADSAQGDDVTYTTYYAPVTFTVADFEETNSSNSELVAVEFSSMPSSEKGTLYYQYSAPNQYSYKAAAGTAYNVNSSPRLSNLTFVPRAGYQGNVVIPYTATRANGSVYSGDVVIQVLYSSTSAHFTDLSYYDTTIRSAVDYLYENGIVSGLDETTYGPMESIRRGDFALMLYKAFNFYAPQSGESFRDVPEDAYYAKAVQTLRTLGIVSGSGNNMYRPDDMLSRQDAMVMVQKALQTAGWSSKEANVYILDDYSDAAQVSSYARNAMAYVLQYKLLPTTGNRLFPSAELTRLDMAQILHRALTY